MDNDTTPLKRCTKCGEEKPATLEHFGAEKRNKSGLQAACRTCELTRTYRWKIENAEFKRESDARYRRDNPEKRRESVQRYDRLNKSKAVIRLRRWRKENPGKYTQQHRNWRANNPDKVRANEHRRRSRKLNAAGSFSEGDLKLQYQSQKGLCWWCGKSLNGEYHADHLIPLAKGGSNWPNNIVCSCAFCNQSKNDKLPHEWNGRLF